MKSQIPPDLAGTFPLSFGLALLLFISQCCLAVALAAHAIFWQMDISGLGLNLLFLNFTCLAINGYALARTVKVRHFLGSFCQWPNLPEEASTLAETRHLANSARQAYFHGNYNKVPNLLDRIAAPSVQALLAKGRALAMDGNFEDAIPFLEQGGEGASARRYLSVRPSFGLFSRRYFTVQDLRWVTRPLRLAILGASALVLSGSVLVLNYNAVLSALSRTTVDFSDKDFKVKTQGVFTFHYHDEAFMRQSAEIGEDALGQILLFLALPPDTFGPGQIHLFLCSDQKEYLARSPYTRPWEAGSAFPQKRQIYLYPLPENQHIYYDVILAHELTHLAYFRIVPQGRQDSWLNEGFADYMGYRFALERAHYPRQAWLKENHFGRLKVHALPFDAFLSENPHDMQDTLRIQDFYIQGFSIVNVLIEQYGQPSFLHFLRVFGAGKSLSEALAASYPTIRNAGDLQAVWNLFMR